MNLCYPFINPPLPYAYDALEPFIDKKTMHLHHDKHLQTYIDNLNEILSHYPQYQNLSLEQLLRCADYMPCDIKTKIKNNAGGVYNHIFFFNNMSPLETNYYSFTLADYIDNSFGSYEAFKEKFTDAALSVFGSGYAWLVQNACHKLKIITTANQNTPLTLNLCPILSIDVWEHAYYLKHYNKRIDYIDDWFHVINWESASNHFIHCNCL